MNALAVLLGTGILKTTEALQAFTNNVRSQPLPWLCRVLHWSERHLRLHGAHRRLQGGEVADPRAAGYLEQRITPILQPQQIVSVAFP